VCILSEKGHKINCFGLISRDNQCHWCTTTDNIDALFVREQLEQLSFQIRKTTFVVLDCARIHTSKIIRERLDFWQQRGLFIFFLPPYSPELNLAETLWRKLKKEWLKPEDYLENDHLFYATNRCLANVGKELSIKFSPFRLN
jgi:transposase